jgi:hypothetical protein
MNIFFLSLVPEICATYYYDKHVGKILLEIAQMMCSIARSLGKGEGSLLYKSTHRNHPVTLWVGRNKENWLWTLKLADALHSEFKYRYGKSHKSYEKVIYIKTLHIDEELPDEPLSEIPLCMPDEYKKADRVESHRLNYMENPDKRRLAAWKGRSKPEWWN